MWQVLLPSAPSMQVSNPFDNVPAALRPALEKKGFQSLTAVQEAVLGADHAGRDLRISSQTGSGKTVALGMAIYDVVAAPPEEGTTFPGPRALVIAPTRELAAQVRSELAWLYEGLGVGIVQVTGGTSIRDELRALRSGPGIVVGTPGRLVDHLERGALDPSVVRAVVLDEADQMLDLGFRDELEAIVGKLPPQRRTHLVSATFSREVLALARKYQTDAVAVEGTRLGEANVDITHEIVVTPRGQREDGLVNIVLAATGEQVLIFARTREGAGNIARLLAQLGFGAAALTGEMEQAERTRTLAAFRSGVVSILVATDVAARGIDVPDVTRVIHADPPNNSEVYVHRSGRTGRAGRKGTSTLLITPDERESVYRLLRRVRIDAQEVPAPSGESILERADARLVEELSAAVANPERTPNGRLEVLAAQLLASADAQGLVATLLERARHAGPCEPRKVASVPPLPPRAPMRRFDGAGPARGRDRFAKGGRWPSGRGFADRPMAAPTPPRSPREARLESHEDAGFLRTPRASRDDAADMAVADVTRAPGAGAGPQRSGREAREDRADRGAAAPMAGKAPTAPFGRRRPEAFAGAPFGAAAPGAQGPAGGFQRFTVTWGERHGADARRLLALVCRRGNIRGGDVGSIQVGATESVVEVHGAVADSFARAAGQPDARDPRIRIAPVGLGRVNSGVERAERLDRPGRPAPLARAFPRKDSGKEGWGPSSKVAAKAPRAGGSETPRRTRIVR